jgi:hypothetical protein
MPQHLRLREFGQLRRLAPAHGFGQVSQDIPRLGPDFVFYLRYQDAALTGAAQLKDDGLVPAGLMEAP